MLTCYTCIHASLLKKGLEEDSYFKTVKLKIWSLHDSLLRELIGFIEQGQGQTHISPAPVK